MNYFGIWYLVLFNLPLDTCTFSRYFERERVRERENKRKKGDIVR